MTIGVAILGSGIFVREEHLPAVLATPTLSLKAIYSRTHTSAQNLVQSANLKNVDLYSDDAQSSSAGDISALYSRDDIQAVIIAVPIPAQPEFILAALKAGKHVLSEKPLAPTVSSGTDLLADYKSLSGSRPLWAVAENFRYFSTYAYAATQIRDLGRVLNFRLRMSSLVSPGGKYYETAWRKTPQYQGGFLLDGGVHFVAGIRQMLGSEARMDRVTAFTNKLREHLPPVDTVDATVRCANGATGTISVSFGTTYTGREYTVACEGGVVEVGFDKVIIKTPDGKVTEKSLEDKEIVHREVKAWAEAIASGKSDPAQSPEEALADLEVIEALLKSGEADGAPVTLK
ncbi:NAD(P)-binding protein, partial [Myriangium duriaei CBS 260.36]